MEALTDRGAWGGEGGTESAGEGGGSGGREGKYEGGGGGSGGAGVEKGVKKEEGECFDDGDFYQQMLRDVVESRMLDLGSSSSL